MEPQFFVGIGAQRAGTTWLADYFATHPQVCFSPIKELHYFDAKYQPGLCALFNDYFANQLQNLPYPHGAKPGSKELLNYQLIGLRVAMVNDSRKYKEYFEKVLYEGARVFGEITPAYSMLDSVGFEAILKMYPKAKFLYILRNPADRYWSHLKFHEGRKKNFSAMEKAFECLDNPQYALRSDYSRTLAALNMVVPQEQLLIVFFEDLFNGLSMNTTLEKITSFLSIDFIMPDIRPANESIKKPLPEMYRKRFYRHFCNVYQFVSHYFNGQIPESWLADMQNFNS